MKIQKLLYALALAAGAAQAAAAPIFTVTYRYPEACELGPYKGLAISTERHGESIMGYNVIQNGTVLQKYRGTLADGSNDIRKGSKYGHIRVQLDYQHAKDPDGNQVTTVSGTSQGEPYKPFDFFGNLYEVKEFQPAEAVEYLGNAVRLECKFEFNSKYSPDSIRANFTRLAKPFDPNVLYRTKSVISTINVNPEWRQFQRLNPYVVLVDDTPALLFPEVLPYRDGSKTVVRVLLPANSHAQNALDFTKAVAAIRTDLDALIAN